MPSGAEQTSVREFDHPGFGASGIGLGKTQKVAVPPGSSVIIRDSYDYAAAVDGY